MSFTTFLIITSIVIVLGLGALLVARWQSGPREAKVPVAPIAVAAVTLGLVLLGFLVI